MLSVWHLNSSQILLTITAAILFHVVQVGGPKFKSPCKRLRKVGHGYYYNAPYMKYTKITKKNNQGIFFLSCLYLSPKDNLIVGRIQHYVESSWWNSREIQQNSPPKNGIICWEIYIWVGSIYLEAGQYLCRQYIDHPLSMAGPGNKPLSKQAAVVSPASSSPQVFSLQ